MRNHWTDKTRIKEAATLLETLLNDEFKGEHPRPDEWITLIEDLIDAIYASDTIIIDGLTEYQISYDLDEFGLVENIRLIEK